MERVARVLSGYDGGTPETFATELKYLGLIPCFLLENKIPSNLIVNSLLNP